MSLARQVTSINSQLLCYVLPHMAVVSGSQIVGGVTLHCSLIPLIFCSSNLPPECLRLMWDVLRTCPGGHGVGTPPLVSSLPSLKPKYAVVLGLLLGGISGGFSPFHC